MWRVSSASQITWACWSMPQSTNFVHRLGRCDGDKRGSYTSKTTIDEEQIWPRTIGTHFLRACCECWFVALVAVTLCNVDWMIIKDAISMCDWAMPWCVDNWSLSGHPDKSLVREPWFWTTATAGELLLPNITSAAHFHWLISLGTD